ncbi:MAG TPA: folylpolyglutamate synthase/dihydrofolate synthase family protein [Thermoplasmata archaeon]|nr:folylpolyglutamate synthase/dihydrofolate synthase family protein [Thermoplasmata archaeon]
MTDRIPEADGRPVPGGRDRYRAALNGLYRRRRFGLRPGLERIRGLLEALGHPERTYPAVHITGSKGKGSVAAMTAAILSAHGLRTGRFTSPHLASYRERIQIDGRSIGAREVVAGVERVDAAAQRLEATGTIDHAPTFFEVTTAIALDWFARRRVDAAVVEVGMGGRLDSTNVLDARVGVVTTIELEHTELLGSTRSAIAREKSGIFHPGMTGVVGELPPDALATVEAEAGRLGVPLWRLGTEVRVDERRLDAEGQTFRVRVPGATFDAVRLPLLGRFQPGNAALAIGAAVRFAAATGRSIDPDRVRAGLADVRWRGRLERVARRPELYYDVAHTPESARAVAQSLAEIAPLADPSECAIVFGVLRGKDVERILDALAPLARTLVVVPVRSERAVPPAELRVAGVGRFPRIVLAPDVEQGVRVARAATGPDGFTLVVGSDYLIGELVRREGAAPDEPDLSDPGTESVPAVGGRQS